MREFQKVIKYLAMAAAAGLACFIIYGIVSFALLLTDIVNINGYSNIFGITNERSEKSFDSSESNSSDVLSTYAAYPDVKNISIEHGFGSLVIKEGDVDEVSVNTENLSKDYTVRKTSGGTLKIENKFKFENIFGGMFNNRSRERQNITVYLPKDYNLGNLEIEAGAGSIRLEDFTVEKMDIEAGAGSISANSIVANKVQLDGGVGEIKLMDVIFEDSDIDSGVGKITLSGQLLGKNVFDSGVGEVDLRLEGSVEDYNLKIEKGLGAISIDGQDYKNVEWENDNAANTLNISGGIGSINIEFSKP
jgi:DUF4097 and DUF4098 domain-containing protein YvlB